MHLTFDDEFNSLSLYNGVSGTWDPTYGFGGLNNFASRIHGDEKQIYVDPSFTGSTSSALGANPFSIHDGILDITAAPTSPALADALEGYQYTSGLITTRESFQQTYGYFEMRAELPQGQGLWPAFWLMPANGGWPPELDVVEKRVRDPAPEGSRGGSEEGTAELQCRSADRHQYRCVPQEPKPSTADA
jgi:beta-glucanase (GH16 family)